MSCRASAAPEDQARANLAMERYARGDDRAFGELYALLHGRLHRRCVALSGASDAEDLMQDVFLKIHRARTTFVPGSVQAWAHTIARTTHLDRVRRRRRELTLEPNLLEERAHPLVPLDAYLMRDQVRRGLSALSENLCAAYLLVKLEGMSCIDAGRDLGVSADAIKQRVHRASEQLKRSALSAVMQRTRASRA